MRMNIMELERKTSGYVEKTAKEMFGIGRAQRAYREGKEISTGDTFLPLVYGAAEGLLSMAAPLSIKSTEDNRKNIVPGFLIDVFVGAFAINFLREGNVQAAFIAKFGYNFLVHVAPDVAKLAKDRFFQRAK